MLRWLSFILPSVPLRSSVMHLTSATFPYILMVLAALDKIYAPGLIYSHSRGSLQSKADLLKTTKTVVTESETFHDAMSCLMLACTIASSVAITAFSSLASLLLAGSAHSTYRLALRDIEGQGTTGSSTRIADPS
jgi:hypothetical protein